MSMLIRDYLERRATENGRDDFLRFRDTTIDFATLNANCDRAANALSRLGVRKGDRVCLLLPNHPDFIYLWFGMAKLGALMVPLNYHLKGEGLRYIVDHCEASTIVVSERYYPAFAQVERQLGGLRTKIWHSDGSAAPPHFLAFDQLFAAADPIPPAGVDVDAGDPCSIIYTSGTTGSPKGALISQFTYGRTGEMFPDELLGGDRQDVLWTCLPLFHANAQIWTTMGALVHGLPMVLRESFSASGWLDDIRATQATIFNYLGGMLTMLMKQPERAEDSDNRLRWAFGGAAPKEIWPAFEKRFGTRIMEAYGLTETGGLATCNPSDAIKMGSIGTAAETVDVAIWDEQDRPLPAGTSGEIVVRGRVPHWMFLGYYKQAQQTEDAWRGGWFHTGDRGRMDEDGYFYFIDRLKDCIRRRGENISSFDIEKIVASHPSVLNAAAVGVPSDLGEDDVKIYVVLRPEAALTPEALIDFCDEHMAYFMVPRYVEFVAEFPKTATERTRKFELRSLGVGKAWDREAAGYKLRRAR